MFASSIISLGEPKKDRSVEQLLKRMEEVNSGDEPASNQVKLEELPLFEFQVLATATDDFSLRSKLGQGGFGPVYKVNTLNRTLFEKRFVYKNLILIFSSGKVT